uniref:Ig-like domain-containing protein n=1 Tax=Elaeophora elaphi TaxID=1147741 RepID=A0A0R3RJV1_9BILA
MNEKTNIIPMGSLFVILLMLNIFIGADFIPVAKFRVECEYQSCATIEDRLVHRNFYWYTKGREERLQNGSTPFGFDHLPSQTVLCVILHKTMSCNEVMEALKNYREYVHTDEFS